MARPAVHSQRRRRPRATQESGPGMAVDSQGLPAIDPTQNVLDLVQAAIQRQDDLREADARHLRELLTLRADYDEKLRRAETARIDAIRAVDVGAVNRAAEVSAQQATTLATQVVQSAETLRNQVAAAAAAANVALAAALEPIQKDIQDLRKAQYEAQGVKANVGESREVRGENRLNFNTMILAGSIVIAALALIVRLPG